jgi:hypothetical protein
VRYLSRGRVASYTQVRLPEGSIDVPLVNYEVEMDMDVQKEHWARLAGLKRVL